MAGCYQRLLRPCMALSTNDACAIEHRKSSVEYCSRHRPTEYEAMHRFVRGSVWTVAMFRQKRPPAFVQMRLPKDREYAGCRQIASSRGSSAILEAGNGRTLDSGLWNSRLQILRSVSPAVGARIIGRPW